MTVESIPESTCARCGVRIHLVAVGKHFMWVSDPDRPTSWHCGTDPMHPVLSHAPEAQS